MNGFDIILVIPLIYSVYKGFKDGVIVQLGGIVAIILGVWLAFKYCEKVGVWIKIDPEIATATGFVVILVATIITIGLLGWLLGKIFNLIGLSIFNRVGGIILSLIKMTIILSALLMAFTAINNKAELVKEKHIKNSYLYPQISKVSEYVFPYLTFMKDKIISKNE